MNSYEIGDHVIRTYALNKTTEVYFYLPCSTSLYSTVFLEIIHSPVFQDRVVNNIKSLIQGNGFPFNSIFPRGKEATLLVWGSLVYSIPYLMTYSYPMEMLSKIITDLDVVIFGNSSDFDEPMSSLLKYHSTKNNRIDTYEYSFVSNLIFDPIHLKKSNNFNLEDPFQEEFLNRMLLQPLLIIGNLNVFVNHIPRIIKNKLHPSINYHENLVDSIMLLDFMRIFINPPSSGIYIPYYKKRKISYVVDSKEVFRTYKNFSRKKKLATKKWLNAIAPKLSYFAHRRGFKVKKAYQAWEKWNKACEI